MYARLAHHVERSQHWRERRPAVVAIGGVADGLQVNVRCVEIGKQGFKRRFVDVARRYQYVLDALTVSQLCRVARVFDVCQWFGVGESYGGQTVPQAIFDELLRLHVGGFARDVGRRLRYLIVLTVEAAQVAARAGDGEALCARHKSAERLFLYRVDGDGARSSVGQRVELAADVFPTPAASALPFRYQATVGAKVAPHRQSFFAVPKFRLFQVVQLFQIPNPNSQFPSWKTIA